MLDMGFAESVEEIIAGSYSSGNYSNFNETLQYMLLKLPNLGYSKYVLTTTFTSFGPITLMLQATPVVHVSLFDFCE